MNNAGVGSKRKRFAIAGVGLLAAGCGQGVPPAQEASQAGRRAISNELRLLPGQAAERLLTLRRMGRFRVACPGGRAEVSFRHIGRASLHAVVDTTARAARSEVLHPGGLMVVRSRRRTALQEWQLGMGTSARADVARVSIAASPGDRVGATGGCLVSGQAVVDRRRRTDREPSG
jgi:hypothetical protein